MRIEENLGDSYNYTVKLFKDIGRLAILIVLNIIPIVNFIVAGYFARVVRESPRGESPPPLERYGELWVDGAKIFVVTLVYMIVPIVLFCGGAILGRVGWFVFPIGRYRRLERHIVSNRTSPDILHTDNTVDGDSPYG